MAGVLKHMTHSFPTHVPVLIGAPEELVTHRELRNKYETNRSIKTWAAWFQLKALTSSCKIQNWYAQRDSLLPWLQMNENTFRRRLKEMEQLQLITLEGHNIILISYQKAADLLGITFSGLSRIPYNPKEQNGNQIFQYFIRAEEFRSKKDKQLKALIYHLDQNPPLKNDLCLLLIKQGAEEQRLYKEPGYFQERLLQLQIHLFKEGSEILRYVMSRRADINRGVGAIKKNHCYKSKQSVSYLKRRMYKLGVVLIEKICVESKVRSRLYVPDGDKLKEGYKWLVVKKKTAWFLTDQITFKYETLSKKRGENRAQEAA